MQPDRRNTAPTAQTGEEGGAPSREHADWLKRAQRAFESSTSYMDSNFRKDWDDSIRAFNNQHPADSKYNQPAYEKRSRVYRPRIRTVIRKNEAAGAAAYFSNMDVVSLEAQDPSNKMEAAGADFMKELLKYRLKKTIPWYQVVLGGLQDAQKQQAACAHVYWEYEEEDAEPGDESEAEEPTATMADAVEEGGEDQEYPKQGTLPDGALVADDKGGITEHQPEPQMQAEAQPQRKVTKDKPCIDLLPLENLRFDPSASWVDPVNTSPYWIHLIPMYVMDVKAKMETGEWLTLGDDIITSAKQTNPDSTRASRQGKDDPYAPDSRALSDYEVVWVQRHIHRKGSQDWHFYTMGDRALLCDPVPLKDVVFHGKRPYVLGVFILETHKVLPSSVPMLAKGLADETNELANQRIDNIKFVLNKKYLVKRGKEADIPGLVRNVPGGVVLMDDPQTDVRELSWADVTGSSFQEAQGLGMEMDELLGNFNPASLMVNGAANNPARNMAMLGNAQGTLVEYGLRTFTVTFVEPILRQLIQLEQYYESDEVVMGLAAKRAQSFQKYGVNPQVDMLLDKELTLTVNVGMGATDPMARLLRLVTALGKYAEMLKMGVPGLDMKEIGKEIFGFLGYADGSRFFSSEDPQILMLQQQVQQLTGVISQLQKKVADKQEANRIAMQKVIVSETNKKEIASMKEEHEDKRSEMSHWRALHEKGVDHAFQARQAILAAARPTGFTQ